MRKEYDFTGAKPNPYAKKLQKQVSVRMDFDTVEFFKKKAEETGIPYQSLMRLYLADCASRSKNINITWE